MFKTVFSLKRDEDIHRDNAKPDFPFCKIALDQLQIFRSLPFDQ